jgi:hypothetical protein
MCIKELKTLIVVIFFLAFSLFWFILIFLIFSKLYIALGLNSQSHAI